MENSVKKEQVDLAATLVSYYEEYEQNTTKPRAESEKNRDYYDNKQWTSEEVSALEARKQPVITFNLVKRTINALIGLEDQNKTDPKGLPRTPKHEQDAAAVTDALRYVCDNNDFDSIALDGFENLLLEGTEAVDIQVEERGEKLEVTLTGIAWDRLFWDVHSRKKDFSDAKYKGIVIWMDHQDAIDRFGDSDALTTAIGVNEHLNDTHEDKPTYKWNDSKRQRVKICYMCYKESGVWNWAYFTNSGIIKGGKPSPYMDQDGQPECQLEFQSAFVDRDGNRYGYTTELISPQDEVNKRRSKGLHLISQRQTFGNKSTGINAADIKKELAKPDGHVEMQHGQFGQDFGIIPTSDMASGNFQLLQEAKEAFNVVGANTSITGQEDRVMSGRAEQIRQQAGARELVPVMFAHKQLKRRVYRQIWNRVRQYWTEERWVRVTDDEKNLKFVAVNKPVTLGDQLKEEFGELPPEYANDPRMSEVIKVENQLSEIDVDIMIEESPDIANIQSEQFELMAKMYQSNPQEIPFKSVLKLSTLRNKDELIEEIEGGEQAQQQQQAQQQAQQEAQEIAKQAAIEDINKTKSETMKNEASAAKMTSEAQQGQRLRFDPMTGQLSANG